MPRTGQLKAIRMRADKNGCLSGPAFSGALMAIWKESRERPEQQVTLLLLDIDTAFAKVLAKGQRCAVSIGVANIPRDAKTPEELMRKADLALYAAKEQGGNTVGLTPADDMVLKSSYYSAAQLARLKALAERKKTKEAALLREGLEDVLRKYDRD